MRRIKLLLCVAAAICLCFTPTRPLVAQGYQIGVNLTSGSGAAGTVADTMGAVGPNHIVQSLNGSIYDPYFSIFDKSTGALISSSSDFWHAAFAANHDPLEFEQIFDQRVVYDHSSQRWFATGLTYPRLTERLVLAVSNTSDPTQGWKAFSFDAAAFGVAALLEGPWADFPRLGVDAVSVNVPLNVTNFATLESFGGLISIPKADLISSFPTTANATISAYDIDTLPWFSIPTVDSGPSKWRAPLLVDHYNSTDILHITNAAGPGPAQLTAITTIPTNQGGPFGGAPDAPQKGNSSLIWTNPTGTLETNSVTVRNTVWYVREVAHDGRSAIRWLEIDEANMLLLNSGVISDPNLYLYFPSIAVNEFGDVVVGFSGSSANDYIGTYAAVGRTVNNVTTFGNVTLLKAGETTYRDEYPTGLHRWGDYSATVLDPADHQSFWTFQEFAQDNDPGTLYDGWGIQITQIKVDRLSGDYNFDGGVNAADYVAWRKTIGATGMGMTADGDGSGTVSDADYFVWREHYGEPATASGASAAPPPAVPEPSTFLLFEMVIMIFGYCRAPR